MNILFWDIDGTLLNTGRAGLYAIEEAFAELQGDNVTIPSIAAGGRTDNYICQQLLFKATGNMPTDKEVSTFCRHYETLLAKWLQKTDGKLFEPAKNIVSYIHTKENYTQLLLTGNSADGAKMKLDSFGILKYFDFEHSGFCEDFYYRDDLARYALQKVEKKWGSEIEKIFVIGDTPFDIQCGKAIGAKTIAVSTGHYAYEQLAEKDAWWCMRELPAPEEFLAKISS